jgi:hypothetical protein
MEISSTQLFPRHLLAQQLPVSASIALVGSILAFDEDAKEFTLQTDP